MKTVLPMKIVVSNCRASLDVITFRGVPADKFTAQSTGQFRILSGSVDEWNRRSDAALIGETMAVLLATGHSNRIPHALTDPVRTMTATIAAEMGETVHGDEHYRVLFILGIVLFIVTCGINIAADLIIKGVKKERKA